MTERTRLAEQWQTVAEALGIRVVRDPEIRGSDGLTHTFALLLPEFGSSRGMLINAEHDPAAFTAALDAEYGCSSMSAETHHLPVDPSDYVDCLLDWGWSAQEPPPPWYKDALAVSQSEAGGQSDKNA
jgi:hypothetical protein